MRRSVLAAVLLFVLVAATAPRARAADAPSTRPAAAAHVVLITIDGFPAALLDDPKAPVPTLRALAKQGTVAAAGMRVINPSITWPNHTTLVTGVRADKHSVLFNGVLTRPGGGRPVRVDPARDQADLVAVPTVFDLLHKAGHRTAAINWPCTRNSPTLDDNFPDVPDQVRHTTPRLRDELAAAAVLPDPTDPAFKALSSPARDQVWTAAACRVVRDRRPELLLFHLLVVDGLHHSYGPGSAAGYTGLALADRHVRDVLEALDAAGIRDRTTVFVVADHGFATATTLVNPNVMLRQAGLLTAGPTGVAGAKAVSVSEGGTALVYLDDRATADAERAKLVELFRGKEGIEQVLGPADFGRLGLPTPDRSAQAPDLVLAAKPGYAFSDLATGDLAVAPVVSGRQNLGYHGYLAENPKMNALFIAAGRGVRPGGRVDGVANVDVAPTIARLLGHDMPGTDGKVLADVLLPEFAAPAGAAPAR
ncbi:MAG TPA: alkaline phosphatase family protein [Humisphaera sp.]